MYACHVSCASAVWLSVRRATVVRSCYVCRFTSIVMLTGLAGDVATTDFYRYTFFALGCIIFFIIIGLFVQHRQYLKHFPAVCALDEIRLADKLLIISLLSWSVYPIFW